MGEALVRTLMVVDSRVLTSGSAFSRADCFLALPTFATSVMERFPWRLLGVFLSKMCEQLRQPGAWSDSVAHPDQVESEARVLKEDVCVALVKLTLETLLLVLSQIVSSCFPYNCLSSALHVLFLSFFSLFAFHLCPFPALPPWCTEAAPTGGRQTPVPCLLLPGDPDPSARRGKATSCCHLLTLMLSPHALRVIFCHTWQKAGDRRWHRDICRPQEGRCVLGVLHPSPGVFGLFA